MTSNHWLELCQLAERNCPSALLDVPSLTDADAHGLLLWLRSLDDQRSASNGAQ